MRSGHDPATGAEGRHGCGRSGANGQNSGLVRPIDVALGRMEVPVRHGPTMPGLALKVRGQGPCSFVTVPADHQMAVRRVPFHRLRMKRSKDQDGKKDGGRQQAQYRQVDR